MNTKPSPPSVSHQFVTTSAKDRVEVLISTKQREIDIPSTGPEDDHIRYHPSMKVPPGLVTHLEVEQRLDSVLPIRKK